MGRQPQCPLNTGERSTSGQRFEKSVLRGLTLSFSISKLPPKSVLGEIALIRLGMVRPDSGRTGDAEVTELLPACRRSIQNRVGARGVKRDKPSGMNSVVVHQRHHHSGAIEWRHSGDQNLPDQKWKIRSLATVS